MKINAKITKTFAEGSVKAIAEVTLDDALAIHGIKLVEGKNGTFVSMPTDKWQDAEGNIRRTDIVHPINADFRTQLFHAVENAYSTFKQSQNQSQTM